MKKNNAVSRYTSLITLLKHRLIGHAGIYLFVGVANAAIGFLLLPVYTRLLTPSQFGLWTIWASVKALYDRIANMGQTSILARSYHQESSDMFRRHLVAGIMLCAVISIGMFMLLLPVTLIVPQFFGLESHYYLLIPLAGFLSNTIAINTMLLRHESKAWQFLLFEVAGALFAPLIAISLIIWGQFAWQALLAGTIAALSILWLATIIQILRRYGMCLGEITDFGGLLKQQCTQGYPLIFLALNAVILASCDRLILAEMTNDAAVGIYAINYKIGMAVQLVTLALGGILVPWIYRQLTDITTLKQVAVAQVNIIYGIAMCAVVAAIAWSGPLLATWLLDPVYHAHQQVIFWAAMGGAAHALYSLFVCYLVYFSHNKPLIVISLMGICINIGATILCVHIYGVVGAAIATFAAYLLVFIAIAYYAHKIYPLPWKRAIKHLMKSEYMFLP